MKLYEFNGGLFPPRIGIYLAEKGIKDIARIELDLMGDWPPPEMKRLGPLGTIPVLETDDGTLIRSSVAILEYLEEIYDEPKMIGETPALRAQTRVLLSVIEEATLQFGIWTHKCSALFASREAQNEVAAQFAAEAYYGRLQKLEELVQEHKDPFLAGPHVTIADCVAMATFQFAHMLFSVPVPTSCPKLVQWYEMFSKRPSAAARPYPPEMVELSKVQPLF